MTRKIVRIVAGFVDSGGIGAVALLIAIGIFGPKPSAPPGERTLSVGPIWFGRMDVSEPVEGMRVHKTVGNWPAILFASAIVGVIGAAMACAPRLAMRRSAAPTQR